MKIVTVLGARPQFVKASVVSHAIAQQPGVQEVVLHTGQHHDFNMSKVFFEELGMGAPAYQLEIHGGTHGAMTGRMLVEVEGVLLAERPDLVLVYGDTNSTLAGALAAVKLHIPVAHVEAGLRSFDMHMPEEVNRIVTDHISRWLFTPTDTAARNLRREGFPNSRIVPVGDVMFDVVRHYGARTPASGGIMERLQLLRGAYALVTIHRAENTDESGRLTAILDALEAFSQEIRVFWPMHPRTRAAVQALGRLDVLERSVISSEPVGYLDMIQLSKNAALIVTDSGGLQKEAFFHEVPCVTLREVTEWVELIEAGWNRLAPPRSAAMILEGLHAARNSRGESVSPYGHGDAAQRVVAHLVRTAKGA